MAAQSAWASTWRQDVSDLGTRKQRLQHYRRLKAIEASELGDAAPRRRGLRSKQRAERLSVPRPPPDPRRRGERCTDFYQDEPWEAGMQQGRHGSEVTAISVVLRPARGGDGLSREMAHYEGTYTRLPAAEMVNGMPLWHQRKPDNVRDRWLYSTAPATKEGAQQEALAEQRWCFTVSAASTPHDPPEDHFRCERGAGAVFSRSYHYGVLPPWRMLSWEEEAVLEHVTHRDVDCRVCALQVAGEPHPRGDPAPTAIPIGPPLGPQDARAPLHDRGDGGNELITSTAAVPSDPLAPAAEETALERVRILQRHGDWLRVRWRGREGYVAAHHLAAGELQELSFLQARHGEGWRRKGTHSADVLLQPEAPDKRFWFYDSFKLSTHHIGDISKRTSGAICAGEIAQTRAFRDIRRRLDHAVRKGQSECPSRFGVLFDIITTNSIIQTGIPHELGSAAYRYIERTHYEKTGLKFVFIGITDNVNSRAARDVFSRDHVPKDSYDRPIPEERKRAFRALDNQHMYPVYPLPESPSFQDVEVRQIGERQLYPGQLIPPKRTIPTVQGLRQDRWEEVCAKAREEASARRRGDAARAAQLTDELRALQSLSSAAASPEPGSATPEPPGSGVGGAVPMPPLAAPAQVTLAPRPQTAGPAGSAMRLRNRLPRPVSAPADGTGAGLSPTSVSGYAGAGVAIPPPSCFVTQSVQLNSPQSPHSLKRDPTPGADPATWKLAEQLVADPESVFSGVGMFTTRGRPLEDPVGLNERLKEAKLLNKHRLAHHSGTSSGAAEPARSRVVSVQTQAQIQKALQEAQKHRIAVGSQVRVRDASRQALGGDAAQVAATLGVSAQWRPGYAARSGDTGVVVARAVVEEGLFSSVRPGALWYAVRLDRLQAQAGEEANSHGDRGSMDATGLAGASVHSPGEGIVLLAEGAVEGGEGGKSVAIAFYAPYSAESKAFLRRWAVLAQEFKTISFLKVNADRMTEVATKCWVECVPCCQLYYDGDLKLSVDDTDEALLRSHLAEVAEHMTQRQGGAAYSPLARMLKPAAPTDSAPEPAAAS